MIDLAKCNFCMKVLDVFKGGKVRPLKIGRDGSKSGRPLVDVSLGLRK